MYLEHYGLERLPFQITPDARFFFESQGHRRALATIVYGLNKNEGFVVVTGEIGAGKTTLIEHVLSDGRLCDVLVARINTSQLESDSLLQLIGYRLGLTRTGESKAQVLRDIEAALLRTARSGRRALLIVDEVQALSAPALEELRMLSNIQDRERPLLQTLLVGQPEFRAHLCRPETEQIRQRVVASYHLAPLAPADVPAYIAFRLRLAGGRGPSPFTSDAVARIARETGGVPRRINRLCDRVLLYGYLEGQQRLGADAVDEVVGEMRTESLEATPPAPAARPPLEAVPRSELAGDGAAPRAGEETRAGTGEAGNTAELLETMEALRRQLATYKKKLARISEVMDRDPGSGARPWGSP